MPEEEQLTFPHNWRDEIQAADPLLDSVFPRWREGEVTSRPEGGGYGLLVPDHLNASTAHAVTTVSRKEILQAEQLIRFMEEHFQPGDDAKGTQYKPWGRLIDQCGAGQFNADYSVMGLAAVISGKKPAVFFSAWDLYDPLMRAMCELIFERGLTIAAPISRNKDSIIVGTPTAVNEVASVLDQFNGKPKSDAYHIGLGKALGYPSWIIHQFLDELP
ncbi:MAG: hypothetical protein KDD64_15355 [Bdellovibrionales bacterium]|nr:hypothetical protein [Bdellovibrionales bacterium]